MSVPAVGSVVWGNRGVFFADVDAWGTVRKTRYDAEHNEILVGVELAASDSPSETLVWVPANSVEVQP